MKYRPDIDGLRAIAVLSVLFYHFNLPGFKGGFVGVDVFFVISGYLITRIILEEVKSTEAFSFSHFYLRRLRRLFPALIFTLSISYCFAFLLMTPEHFMQFSGSVIYSISSLSNFYFWSESGYFDGESHLKPLLNTWSLSVEEQFYLVWPILLVTLLTKIKRIKPSSFVILAILLSLGLNQLFIYVQQNNLYQSLPFVSPLFANGTSTIFYLAPFRAFEFGIGALLVWIPQFNKESQTTHNVAYLSGMAMIISSVVFFNESMPFPSYNALLPCLGTALVIYSGSAAKSAKLVSVKPIVFCGLISYSLYLIHWPVLVFYRYIYMSEPSFPELALLFSFIVIIASLMYRYIEQPFRRGSREASGVPINQFTFGFGCAISAILVCVLSATSWANNGWSWRVSDNSLAYIQNPSDYHTREYGGEGFAAGQIITLGNRDISPSFVMFGDSFALGYATGISEWLKQNHISAKAVFDHGCLIAPDLTRFINGQPDIECSKQFEKVLSLIRGNQLPILVNHDWSFYADTLGRLDGTALKFEDFEAYLKSIFQEMIEQLGAERKIFVLGLPPLNTKRSYGGMVTCLLRPSFLIGDCPISHQDESLTLSYQQNLALSRHLSNYRNVEFINPSKAFCTDGVCRSILEGRLIFSDGGHLSKHGSRLFVKRAEHDLKMLIQ